MQDHSLHIEQLWQGLDDTTRAPVQRVLAEVVRYDKDVLAEAFYRHMLADPAAAQFLSVKAVEDRLRPGLAQWLEQLFCHADADELKAVLALQRHVGEIHARVGIPVNLVARGMRLLKREIAERLLATTLDRDDLVHAVLRADRLIDIAFEEMSSAFVHSRESGVRVDEAYRMFSAGHNLSLERERQLGAVLDWENRLFRALATDLPTDNLSLMSHSPFGLWLHHKANLIFDATHELPLIDACVQRIDQTLFPQWSRSQGLPLAELRSLVRAVTSEIERIKFLLEAMFDRMTDLEVGRDALTQLFNRRFLQTVLRREIELNRRRGDPFCVLMLDIDFFKQVNDQHGHEAGDRVLQGVAALLVQQVRAGDFVFRYGGEEFLVVLTEVDAAQAQAVAEKMRRRVEQARMPVADDRMLNVTLSIGIAAYDGHPDYQRMVDLADKALYAAKAAGRNRCVLSGA